MTQKLKLAGLGLGLSLALGACDGLTPNQSKVATQALTAACNTSTSAMKIATNRLKVGALSETQAKVVDYSAAVIDGFCAEGTPVPKSLNSAVKAVSTAGVNIMALGF
jgi:hypothetical protein